MYSYQSNQLLEEACGTFAYRLVKPMLEHLHQLTPKNNENDAELTNKNKRILELEEEVYKLKTEITIQKVPQMSTADVLEQLQKQQIKLDNLENHLCEQQNEMINKLKLNAKSDAQKLKENEFELRYQKFKNALQEQKIAKLKADDEKLQLIDEINSIDNFSGDGIEEGFIPNKGDSNNIENKQEKKKIIIDFPELRNIPLSKGYTVQVLYDSDVTGPGWTVIQQRINGKVDFYKDWKTYRNGFGDFWDGDFFLGLEKIHQLTNEQPHELYILMEQFNGSTLFARYSEFAISSEDDLYLISKLDGFSGNTTDELKYHKGSAFTTHDRNNDALTHDYNCAEDFHSAWWYKLCAKW